MINFELFVQTCEVIVGERVFGMNRVAEKGILNVYLNDGEEYH